jgi:hypothetical protein
VGVWALTKHNKPVHKTKELVPDYSICAVKKLGVQRFPEVSPSDKTVDAMKRKDVDVFRDDRISADSIRAPKDWSKTDKPISSGLVTSILEVVTDLSRQLRALS